ncbi:hypothetical protein Cgig2_028489 [Carnegiea gigantea]|uniref:Uncharacterized protein n=1 Tax=Carnegiea gigantea TaxID=171969 RepID=A0A9Q1GR59_9CARY|nr:hypothetical protein Cgig2_028489 [Carnegiea gigantea]
MPSSINARVTRFAQCQHETAAISTTRGNPQYRAFPTSLFVAEQAAEYYELPKLPQVIFYVIFSTRPRSLVALTELRWGAFESWIWLFGDRVYEAQFHPKSGSGKGMRYAFPPIHNTREMTNYARETFIWRWRSASRPPRPLPEDFNLLYPCFSLAEAEAASAELELLEIVQTTFYAMLLNEMFELGMVHEYTAERMKLLLVGLRWSTFKVLMRIMDEVIWGAQFHRLSNEVDVKGARDGKGEGSGSADPPAPSSDEE